MNRRNPDNPQKTVNNYFYLPEFGAFGQEEYAQYNLARENLDRFLREMYDRSYTLPNVNGYRLSPPEIDWFYSLHGMPHWRTIRGFWKFEQQAGDPQAVDSSIYGQDGGSRYTAMVTPGSWHQLGPGDGLPVGFFLENGDSCLRTRSSITDGIAAEIPGILHHYPVNPDTGKKELTIEFWWSPEFSIYGGDRNNAGATYPASACLISKINRLLINQENRWISDELTIQLLPADVGCEITGGPLSFNTHRFQPGFTPGSNCDFSDWGFAQSTQYRWTKQEWYYVVATWSEDTGMALSVNLQQDPVYGSDVHAVSLPEDGIESNLIIGNYWNRFKTNQGIDSLFSEMRISNKIRSSAEQAYAFNSGSGRRLTADEHTLGLWHFDEGQGVYGFNAYRRQTENLPIFGVPGIVKKGYIYQPDTAGSSSGEGLSAESSGEITHAAEFVRFDSQYLDCGTDDYLNMQTFGGEVCYKFAATFAVKRRSTGSRQTILSKWRESDGKQYWIGFNDEDQIEFRLGKGADVTIERVTDVISNPYGYAEITNSGISGFDGVYVDRNGYDILNSSNSEESSESSWGPYGAVNIQGCEIPEINGWYDFLRIEGNDGVPEHAYPYIEIAGAGTPAVNGQYVSQDDWDTARVVYEDPTLPFPNIKVENAQLFDENGIPIEAPSSQESSSGGPTDIDFNGIYVPEEYWTQAKDAILGPGAPDPSTSLVWETVSNNGTFGVWRKVSSDRDYTMFHAGDSWDGWILGLNADYNDSFYYSYRMRHDQPPVTWLTMAYLQIQDSTIRALRSEEFYTQDLIQITKWNGGGKPIWRKTDNPDLEIYADTSDNDNYQWTLGIFESVYQIQLYWASFYEDEFPLRFYISSIGLDPGPTSRIYNYPPLQGGDGRTIWQNRDNPDFYIYRDYSPWEPDWAAWFIGKGTDHQENYFFSEWHRGQTDIIPPSQWFLDYYGQGPTPVGTQYPLQWSVNGQEVYRKATEPAFCVYRNTHPDSDWTGWFFGKGTDAVNAMWWSDDNQPFIPPSWYVMNDPNASPPSADHFYAQYLPTDERPDPESTPVADPHPQNAEITSLQRVVNREAGIEDFAAVSEDKILDTDTFHQVVVSWSKHYYNGKPKIFIDGAEVSAYVQQDAYRGNMPYLTAAGEEGSWAPVNIGRTYDVGSSSQETSSSNPDWYLDATLDEVAIFAGRLIDEEVASLWGHLKEGAQDGDRWYIDDPNLRVVSGNELIDEFGDLRGDRLSDPATGEWEGYKEYFADWRRDAVTGEFGWYFHPVEYSGVFWNNEAGRLESWLPDEYYELWGDYGSQGTGSFNIG